MGFFEEVKAEFGFEAVLLMKEIMKIIPKLGRAKNRRIFLLRCRSKGVFPAFIQRKVACLSQQLIPDRGILLESEALLKNFKNGILDIHIRIACSDFARLTGDLYSKKEALTTIVPLNMVNNFIRTNMRSYDPLFIKVRGANCRKFEAILRENTYSNTLGNPDWVLNRSDVSLPDVVSKTISLGPKFSVIPSLKEFPMHTFLSEIHHILKVLGTADDVNGELRSRLLNVAHNFCNSKNNNGKCSILRQVIETRRFLKSNLDLCVLKADKGNSSVVMNRLEYKNKMIALLDDSNTYKHLTKDPTLSIQGRFNKKAKSLYDSGFIDIKTKKRLTTYNSRSPKIYGLPKAHKPGVPLRPVVSCIQSPSIPMARLITSILSNVIPMFPFNVQNSYGAMEKIVKAKLPLDYVLVSFDVTSLFTNISKEAVLSSLRNNWDLVAPFTSIPMDVFLEMVTLVFDSSYFQYDGSFYSQLIGSAMGDPCSPIFANFVMNDLLLNFLGTINFQLPFLMLYVDDILTAIPSSKVDYCLEVLNGYDRLLDFTYELESGDAIPFLDLLVCRGVDGSLYTDLYKKPSSTERVLNFHSAHPMSQKLGVINTLKLRILSCVSPYRRGLRLYELKEQLIKNDYPHRLAHLSIFNSKEKRPVSAPVNLVDLNVETRFCRVAFHPWMSNKIKTILSDYIRDKRICLAFYNRYNLGNLVYSRMKDSVPILSRSNLVYKVVCECGSTYVGQTKQLLSNRIKQHVRDAKVGADKTGLSEHLHQFNHFFEYKDVSILAEEPCYTKRSFLEASYIGVAPLCINKFTDFAQIDSAYKALLSVYYSNLNRGTH